MTVAPGGALVVLNGARVFSHSKVRYGRCGVCVTLQLPWSCCGDGLRVIVMVTDALWQLALVQAACYNGEMNLKTACVILRGAFLRDAP
jgi:hypothetical protein